jgi:hypothetical protein
LLSKVPILHTGPTMLDINSYQSIEPINNETVQSVSEIDVPSSKFEDITMNTTTENVSIYYLDLVTHKTVRSIIHNTLKYIKLVNTY